MEFLCSPLWAVSKVSSVAMYSGLGSRASTSVAARTRAVPGCASGAFAAPLRRARVVQAAGLVAGRLFCGRCWEDLAQVGEPLGKEQGARVCRARAEPARSCGALWSVWSALARSSTKKHCRVPRGLCTQTAVPRRCWQGVFSMSTGSRASAQDSVRCRRWCRWIARRSCTRATTT